MSKKLFHRRNVLSAAAAGFAAYLVPGLPSAFAATSTANDGANLLAGSLPTLSVRQIRTDQLDVGYHEAGPQNGRPVILLHGYPYDIHSFIDVIPMLTALGLRVIVPHLRGHGTTRFLKADTPRAGQQAALGEDLIAFMDAMRIPEAVLAGFDWGGRAACVAAALWPSRCVGLVSVNSYLIQNIALAGAPLPPNFEWGIWYWYYFQTERGRMGLTSNRREINHIVWKNNSPAWQFSEAMFDRAAKSFDNPDYVDVVVHSYRHRLGLAQGFPQYEESERRLATMPPITVPAITLDGMADGVVPANDGLASAARFKGPRTHRKVPDAGHNLPQEAPQAFADAVAELMRNANWRT